MTENIPSYSIIRLPLLMTLTGLSRSTLYDKQNPKCKRFDPTFPKRVSLGERAVGWRLGDVEAWLNAMK